jgi:hypothetical protein
MLRRKKERKKGKGVGMNQYRMVASICDAKLVNLNQLVTPFLNFMPDNDSEHFTRLSREGGADYARYINRDLRHAVIRSARPPLCI